MIVAGADYQVIDLDGFAAKRLACPYEREGVPGATPLSEEPGSLKQVVDLVGDRFASNPTHAGAGS
ncbi:hypothetical protein ACP2AV_01190 [Aliiroseovarius sp. PTFE2010]|uniref:hypothetical protein n=1 Tax=Aliiroseovarius sp. PTFE2010 TaxID=3417190 RepID=UPI003CE8D455